MNTPARRRSVRILFYAALLIAMLCGAAAAWLVGAGQTPASLVLALAMLIAMIAALMLDYSEEEPL